MDKRAFRKRIAEGGGSGWAQKTDSELLAWAMYDLTNNPNYLNQPIFIPKEKYFNFNNPTNLEKITKIFFTQRRKMIKK